MAGKRNAIKDATARALWGREYILGGCMICGTKKPDWRGFSVHHIRPGRDGRSDEPCNYLLVCGTCHDLCEGLTIRGENDEVILPITDGMQLTLKFLRDPEDWCLERLAALAGERLPLMVPPHSWINAVYRENKGKRPWKEKYVEDLSFLNDFINSYVVQR